MFRFPDKNKRLKLLKNIFSIIFEQIQIIKEGALDVENVPGFKGQTQIMT